MSGPNDYDKPLSQDYESIGEHEAAEATQDLDPGE